MFLKIFIQNFFLLNLFKEVDNNLDKQINYSEFEFMYKRNIYDKNG